MSLSKHPTLGKKSIAYKYFLHPQDIPGKILQTNKHIRKDHLQTPKNIEKWTFQGLTRESGRYQDRKKELKGKIVYLVKPNDFEIDRARKYATPKGLHNIHAYHPEHLKLVEFNDNNNTQTNRTLRQKLLKRQEGTCAIWRGRIDLFTPPPVFPQTGNTPHNSNFWRRRTKEVEQPRTTS